MLFRSRPPKHNKPGGWHGATVCFAWSVCLIEVKSRASQDLFTEKNGKTVFSPTEDGQKTREQILRYVVELFLRQHRESVFIVLIIGRQARLTRWDRTGVITTAPFDYTEGSHHLFTFVYRLGKSNRAGQGFDPTVLPASQEQIKDLKAFKETVTNKYEQQFLKEMLEDEGLYPIQQVCVSDIVFRVQ